MSECVNTEKNYEHVNHPSHYNNYSVEVIDMMKKIWGIENTIRWCEMTAFKYRMRMGTKPGNSIEQELNKEKWLLEKKKELISEFENEIEDLVQSECIQYLPPTHVVESIEKENYTSMVSTNENIEFFATNTNN